ncbi:MOSC domain-containing protein [Halorussus gelatinilyticus]|uniref:MOSC domain-containing protein n=1 Tax=Halorussus gelatinilyticus TaxID=2937524 RepID=A0A8U0ILH2_9EURY|nr:MOSC domain-containing protein [Halorussus gelatinilyticus]UPW01526.1 MOSC domain-containing protein [Halorussus gelatinilyticus]
MDGTGRVEAIHLAPESGAATEPAEAVEVVAGEGVRGDRHFGKDKADLTLVESEALDAAADEGIDLTDGEHRRNLTTSDAALNHLAGERFRVGEAVCEGNDLCEPCGHLESLTEDGAISALVHRGGLEADVIESGEISVGDEIEPL